MTYRKDIAGSLGWQVLALIGILTTGVVAGGLVQLFKIDVRSQSHIVNASARGMIGDGEAAVTLGFVIVDHAQTIVARALGPTLSRYGVVRVIGDPSLRIVRDSDGVEMARNNHWRESGNDRLKADLHSLAPPSDREAACVLRLEPGSYSVIVEGKGGQHGTALAEIYKVDE